MNIFSITGYLCFIIGTISGLTLIIVPFFESFQRYRDLWCLFIMTYFGGTKVIKISDESLPKVFIARGILFLIACLSAVVIFTDMIKHLIGFEWLEIYNHNSFIDVTGWIGIHNHSSLWCEFIICSIISIIWKEN